MLACFFLGMFSATLLFGLLTLRSRRIRGSKQLIEQRECSSLAFHFVIIIFRRLHLSEHTAHLIGENIQVFLGNTHLLHSGIDLRYAQTSGAAQAVAFVHSHAVLYLGDKNNGNILLTFGTHFRGHRISHLSSGQYTTHRPEKEKQIINKWSANFGISPGIQTIQCHRRTTNGSYTDLRGAQ